MRLRDATHERQAEPVTDTNDQWIQERSGIKERRFVAPGSGFVALDKNGNGRIDDGSELFGATTGDGFEELAAYDDDGNGWIDEDDAVFDQLEVWSKDAAGNDQRAGLAEHNVGAIYLGRVAAPHSYRNRDNENVAQMRTAGFYVGEIGHRAGSMQQLDLVV